MARRPGRETFASDQGEDSQEGGRVDHAKVVRDRCVENLGVDSQIQSLDLAGSRIGRAAYLSALRYVSLVATPMAIGLALLAGPIVLTFFGDQWGEAIPILRALAVYAGLRALGSNAGDVLKASGRTQTLALLAVVKTAVLIPALVFGARHGGAVGVAVAMATVTGFGTLLNLSVMLRVLRLRPVDLLSAVAPGVPAAAALALGLAGWSMFSTPFGVHQRLIGALVLGPIVYLGALRLTSPQVYRQAREGLRE